MTYNFSAGPAVIYTDVLEEIQDALLNYKNLGYSLIESSHREKQYDEVHNNAIACLKDLLRIGDDYQVLLLGGGATLQFAMLPYNFLLSQYSPTHAQYINSGLWAQAAIRNAQKVVDSNKDNTSIKSATLQVIYDGKDNNYTSLPNPSTLNIDPQSTFVHLTSNETVQGIQWKKFPQVEGHMVIDMSSDILSRTLDINQFSCVYAGTQKNLGTSGVTVVILKKDFLHHANECLPDYLSYKLHSAKNSLLNTPPVFSIWVLERVLNHIKSIGGIHKVEEMNIQKSQLLYQAIDESDGFYCSSVDREVRSDMNVVFTLPNKDFEQAFLWGGSERSLIGLKGHRSVGGCRVSLYNAMKVEGVQKLIEYMKFFKNTRG